MIKKNNDYISKYLKYIENLNKILTEEEINCSLRTAICNVHSMNDKMVAV